MRALRAGRVLTGDLGRLDEDSHFWFVGRTDDVITSSGYRIGPGEIEKVLTRHPAVQIAAAIGVPDPVGTETVMAFVVLCPNVVRSDALAVERSRASRAPGVPRGATPSRIRDRDPTTTTGKIMRRVLKERELVRFAAKSNKKQR